MLKKYVWNSNFIGRYFQVFCCLLISQNYKTVFAGRGQVLVLIEVFFSERGVYWRISGWKCVIDGLLLMSLKLRRSCGNVRANNGLIFMEQVQERFGLFDSVDDVRRVQKVIDVVEDVSVFWMLWFEKDIFAVCELIAETNLETFFDLFRLCFKRRW